MKNKKVIIKICKILIHKGIKVNKMGGAKEVRAMQMKI